MKINFVTGTDIWRDDRQPGDAEWLSDKSGIRFICPKCLHLGEVRFWSPNGWTWDGNVDAPTVTPSILHDAKTCGWHGYLTAGEFQELPK